MSAYLKTIFLISQPKHGVGAHKNDIFLSTQKNMF